jgi:hypothetical protein
MDENQLRIPTVALNAEIRYFDERAMAGRIFLPALAQHHGGPTRPDEWMNQGSMFFPFVSDEGGPALILNKRYVIMLTLAAVQDFEVTEDVGIPRTVRVECGNLAVEGLLYIDMPVEQSRVLDFVNRGESFLILRDAEQVHLIQKNRITLISEIRKD